MKYDFSHGAMKALGKLDSNTAGRIIKGVLGLPSKGQIKPLEGEFAGLLRLRIGDWRVIYEIIDDCVYIRDISPRGGAYQ